jgi:hypothetical protein
MTATARPITGRYRLTVREQLGMAPALNRGTLFSLASAGIFVVLALLSLATGDPIGASLELAFAAALYSGYYCVPFAWFTLRRHRAAAEAPVDLEADDDGLRFETRATRLEIPWDRVSRIRETPTCFFGMARYPRAFMLPKRAFGPSQLAAFRKLAASKTIFRKA